MALPSTINRLLVAFILVMTTACTPFISTGAPRVPAIRSGATTEPVAVAVAPAVPLTAAISVDEAGVPTEFPIGTVYTDTGGHSSTVIEIVGTRGLLAPAPRACGADCATSP
jgi:hypothetical protein